MPDAASQLADLIAKLQNERQEHVDAIAKIDAAFARFGITPSAPKRRGRPRKTAAAAAPAAPPKRRKRRTRRKFAVSGLDSVFGFVKSAGKKGATTSEIVGHWKSEGRSGNGYTALGQLVKEKKLKKQPLKGGRGSRYVAS